MKGSVLRFTKIVYFVSGYNKTGLNCSWGKNCLKLSIYFSILLLLFPLAYKCSPSFELIKLNFFYLKILCVNFGWILPRFWRKDMNILALHNSFALIRESYAFIRESYAFIRESLALIRESYALIREKYNFFLYENEPNRLSYLNRLCLSKCVMNYWNEDTLYKNSYFWDLMPLLRHLTNM